MITTTYHYSQTSGHDPIKSNLFQAPAHDSIKIAVVSDLHDRSPRKALAILNREKPDLILIPGDLMERHQPGEMTSEGIPSEFTEQSMIQYQGKQQLPWVRILIKILDGSYEGPQRRRRMADGSYEMISHKPRKAPEKRHGNRRYDRRNGYYFLQKASQIAPVCYSSGNHEWYHTPKDMAVFRKYQIHFLDNATTTIHIKGLDLIIGGLPTKYDTGWLRAFAEQKSSNTTRKILLMHHPEYYDRYVAGQDTFDLIVSGHAHGGQLRLFGHGIYAPNQGFLPRYHHGIYPAHGIFIVSAGVSNTNDIPRLGNPTEVVIIN